MAMPMMPQAGARRRRKAEPMPEEALPTAPDPASDPLGEYGPAAGAPAIDPQQLISLCESYRADAEEARKTGPNPRDDVWKANWDLYWGRYDMSKKATWQSKLVMPEAAQFVDRWSAAMREALNQAGEWFEVFDDTDTENDLVPHVKRFLKILLAKCGRTQSGHEMDFSGVFEDLMKLASITAGCTSVTWSYEYQCCMVECVDPLSYWLDPTGRRQYRVRRLEIDKHELLKMATQQDGAGQPLWNVDEIRKLSASIDEEDQQNRQRTTGHGAGGTGTKRKPVVLHEYLCTVLGPDGNLIAENQLCVIANNRFLVRGPEANPYWHQRDWIVFAPLINVPLAIYGRSYMENWSSVASAFVEMTNLVLDATFTTAMKMFAAVPDMLEDPTELQEGAHPNKVFSLQSGEDPKNFMREIELGELSASAVTVWQNLKNEMREGALLNEIALGQVPTKGERTATEIEGVSQSSSAMVRSMARSVEVRQLEPILELVWHCGLQHVDFADPRMVRELGEATAVMLQARKEEFRQRKFRFQVRAISGVIERTQKLRNMLAFLQTIGSNEILLREFLTRNDSAKVFDDLVGMFGVDTTKWKLSERERMARALIAAQPGAPGGAPPQPGKEGANGQGGNSANPTNMARAAVPALVA